MSILSEVPWGEPARNIVVFLRELDYKLPTFIIIRHSEREEPPDIMDVLNAPLTIQGKKAAFEFGNSLPEDLTYHLYHSSVERCRETSQCIQKGIQAKNGKTIYGGEMETLLKINGDSEKIVEYIGRDNREFMQFWTGSQYPSEHIEPAVQVAQRTFSEIMRISKSVKPKEVNILVSHDLHILTYLFYWAGIAKCKDWIQYLEGFILQLTRDKLIFYYRDGKEEKDYPKWWKDP